MSLLFVAVEVWPQNIAGQCQYVTDRYGNKQPCVQNSVPVRRRESEPIWLPPPDPRFETGSQQFEAGKRAFQSRNWLFAVSALEQAVASVPENQEYRLWLGRARENLKAWQLIEAERLDRIVRENIANRETPSTLKPLDSELPEEVLKPSESTDDGISRLKPSGTDVNIRERDIEIRKLRKAMAVDIARLRQIGFGQTNSDLLAWVDLAEANRKSFESKVRDTLTDIAISNARVRLLKRFKDFDSAKAARVIRWLEKQKVISVPEWVTQAIDRVGRAKYKPQVADDAERIIDYASKAKDVVELAKQEEISDEDAAEFVMDLLEGLVNDPRASILVTELRLFSAALYNTTTQFVARREIDRLIGLTDQKRREVESIAKSLENKAKRIRKLEREGL